MDSLAVVHAANNVQSFIQGILPGLSDDIAIWIAKLVCSFPILVLVFANEWIGKWLASRSPFLAAYLSPFWDKVKFLANPILAAVLGGLGGDSAAGAFAGVLWGIIKGGTKSMTGKDLSSVTKAKAIAFIVALGLCVSSFAHAQEAHPLMAQKPQASFIQQTTFGIGAGFERGFEDGQQYLGFLDAQLGMSWNHLAPRIRVVRYFGEEDDFSWDPRWKGEVALRLIVW